MRKALELSAFACSIAVLGALVVPVVLPPSHAQVAAQCQAVSIRCPVATGCVVTDSFRRSRPNPVTGKIQNHAGVDYAAARGIDILAAADGTVEESRLSTGGLGEVIVVRHADGGATLYAHLLSRSVQAGASVKASQSIGKADSTGQSTGDHLHFEYVPNGAIILSPNRIDPHACVGAAVNGSIRVSDNGSLADDAFRIAIDGLVVGETQIGQANNIAINNLIPGRHRLTLTVIVAPDDVGTYQIDLSNGWRFSDGTTTKSGAPPLGTVVNFDFDVPAS